MRLTLRTLLAYLDDLLEPAQAKELGAKIQESEVAAELVMKIRDVIRKRRLTAPIISGPGCDLDANVVAEYLDNTLPPDGVTQLEQLCLESDVHLAEVAACHQILTLVLGEPIDINSHSRERMYALGSGLILKSPEAEPHTATGTHGSGRPGEAGIGGPNRKFSPAADRAVDHAGRSDSFIARQQSGSIHPSSQHPNKSATFSHPAETVPHTSNAHATPSALAGSPVTSSIVVGAHTSPTQVNSAQAVSSVQTSAQISPSAATSEAHSPIAEHVALTPKPISATPVSPTAGGLGPAVKSVTPSRNTTAGHPTTAAGHDGVRPGNQTHPRTGESRYGEYSTGEQSTGVDTIDRTIPEYLKQPPLWKRAVPLAALLLLAVWVGMLIKDQDLLSSLLGRKPQSASGNQVAALDGKGDPSTDPQAELNSQSDAAANDATSTAARRSTAKPEVNAIDNSSDVMESPTEIPADDAESVATTDRRDDAATDPEMTPVETGVDAPPPAEAGDPLAGDVPQPRPRSGRPRVPAGTELPGSEEPLESDPVEDVPPVSKPGQRTPKPGTEVATTESTTPDNSDLTAPAPMAPMRTNTAKTNPAGQPDNRPKPARYVSQEGVVLRYDDDREGWFPLPHREFVFAEDILAVPEPFDAQVQFGTEKHRLTALGPTLFQVVDLMTDVPLGISMERGRIVLQPAETPAGEATPRMKLSVSVQGATWLLELPDANSRCGVEIIPREPRQFEEDFGTQGWSGRLYCASGTVKITTPEGKATIITGPDTYVLAPDSNTVTPPVPTSVLPSWLGERKLTSAAKLNASQFQRTLTQDELSAHDALLGAVTDRVPEKSRLATACLGLTGDYQMMLEILDRNEHHESREAAINALRAWVNLNPANREKLQTEIGAKFFKEDATTIYRMLWGYQEQDLRGKQVSRQLVDYLSHDSLAVRELACYYIRSLTSRRLDFDARGPQTQRNMAIQQLNKILDKDETLLPALPKGAASLIRRN